MSWRKFTTITQFQTSIRDNFIAGIQNILGTGLAILANMINELKRKTISPLFTPEHQFGKINECMLLLAEAHKQSTLLRRQNVKHLLNDSLHILCSKRAMEKRCSNACVFEEDMGIQNGGAVVQWLERAPLEAEVVGSIPVASVLWPLRQDQKGKSLYTHCLRALNIGDPCARCTKITNSTIVANKELYVAPILAAWGWDSGEQGFQEEEVRPRGGNPRTISSS